MTEKPITVFNADNTAYLGGEQPIFLGQPVALFDSLNRTHQILFDLYKEQKSIDWAEDEIPLESCRTEMLNCPKPTYDAMIMNIAYQWEADSIAAFNMTALLAPFVTNSEAWIGWCKIAEIECLHTLTYSEIVRICVPDPMDVFNAVMKNEKTLGRMKTVSKAFVDMKRRGAEYTLGMCTDDQETYNIIYKFIAALYMLERLQFMASFAATFAIVDQGYFQPIGKLVQKIMQDERGIHAVFGENIIQIELATERGRIAQEQTYDEVKAMLDEVLQIEMDWSAYLLSEGRSIIGCTVPLLCDWVLFNAKPVYKTLGIKMDKRAPKLNPFTFMDRWMDMNKFQNANQEIKNTQYRMNSVFDDLGADILEWK